MGIMSIMQLLSKILKLCFTLMFDRTVFVLRACHTIANSRFCDKLVAKKVENLQFAFLATRLRSTIYELLEFPGVKWPKTMRLRSWCRIGVLFPVKLSLEIGHRECARSLTQLNFDFLFFSLWIPMGYGSDWANQRAPCNRDSRLYLELQFRMKQL